MVRLFFFFQAEDGIRDVAVTGVQTCTLPIYYPLEPAARAQYVERFVGFDDGKSSDRVLDAAQSLIEGAAGGEAAGRSEEHTSELQSRLHLVCRLLLEKKKKRCE